MSNDLLKDNIVLDKKIGRENTQILLEGDIIVPDIKPDISVVLQNDAKVVIERVEVSQNRVNFIGRLDIQILYLAKGSERPIHSMTSTVVIDDFISMENVSKDMWVEVDSAIQNINYKVLNDRKLSFKSVIDIVAVADTTETYDVISNIEGLTEKQIKRSSIDVCRSVCNKNEKFIIKEEVKLQNGNPNIREILQLDVDIISKELRIQDGKASVVGSARATILYKGDTDDSIIELSEAEIPFNGSFDMQNVREDMNGDIKLCITDQYIVVKPDEDGEDRVFEVEATIDAIVKVRSEEKMEILEDAYCINKDLKISKIPINYKSLVCRNKNQSTIKEVVQVDGPELLQVFRVRGNCKIDDIKKMEDKIIVEGIVNVDILYIAESDETPLYSYETVIPFRQVIEAKGLKPNMEVDIASSVDHVGFNMLSDKEIELRILVSFNAEVLEIKVIEISSNIEFVDIPKDVLEKMASAVVYIVQKGDTLWSIAKKYNTDIEDIININEIEDPDCISEGKKLLILKKIVN